MANDELVVTEFIKFHPDEAAGVIEQFPMADVRGFFESLPTETGSALLSCIAPSSAHELLRGMEPAFAGGLLSAIPPATAAVFVRRLGAEMQGNILTSMPKNRARALRLLLSYPENCVGSLMDPEILVVPSDTRVGAARELLRQQSGLTSDYICVASRDQRLLGIVDLGALILAQSESPIQSVMRADFVSVSPYTGTHALVLHPAWRDHDVLPLVDEAGLFLGVIRHRDLRRIRSGRPSSEETGSGLDSILPLGEMYWLGLWDVFQSIASSKPKGANERDSA